jgi:molybdopterin/thiamine biosynthesis adenylyltransferase
MDRYDRQRGIPGWSQERLAQAFVVVVGADLLGQLIALGLACLGVGRIGIVDSAWTQTGRTRDMLRLLGRGQQPRAPQLTQLVKKVNPEIRVFGQRVRLLYEECFRLLPTPSLVIEASADPISKYACLRYSQKWCVPVIFGAASPTEGRLSVHLWGREHPLSEEEYCLPSFSGQQQDVVTAMFIAGLALEEARKILMPLDERDQPISQMLIYNRQSKNRFDADRDYTVTGGAYGGDCLLVGAGALGNWLGIALVLSGVRRLTIVDYDQIEGHNLNRQVLFYEAVGQAKAPELARKLHKLNASVECVALVERVSAAYFQSHQPDLIFSAVDNFAARALLSRIAVRCQLALIDGGTSPYGGQVMVYRPGDTACLNCQGRIEDLAEQERREGRDRQSCAQAPEPSVVMPNMIIAALMAGEAGAVLRPDAYGPPVRGTLGYSASLPSRLGLHSVKEPCSCERIFAAEEATV